MCEVYKRRSNNVNNMIMSTSATTGVLFRLLPTNSEVIPKIVVQGVVANKSSNIEQNSIGVCVCIYRYNIYTQTSTTVYSQLVIHTYTYIHTSAILFNVAVVYIHSHCSNLFIYLCVCFQLFFIFAQLTYWNTHT